MNKRCPGDDPGMIHLLNAVCGSVLVYATITRGGLLVARGFAYVAGRVG
jgi:hypothetical protein